jgi:hypothetical protein
LSADLKLFSNATVEDFLEQIVSLIGEIEKLFPAPQAQTTLNKKQQRLATSSLLG